jgi:hypothetical protein
MPNKKGLLACPEAFKAKSIQLFAGMSIFRSCETLVSAKKRPFHILRLFLS